MLGIDRRTLRVVWTVFLFALVVLSAYEARHTLMIFTLALFFAHLLGPVVAFFERRMPARVPRVLILVLVYVALTGVLVLALISIGSRIGEEAASLAARFPALIQQQDPLNRVPLPSAFEFARPKIGQFLKERLSDLDQHVLPILSTAGAQIISGIGNILSTVLIPILSFFFLKDGAAIRRAIVGSFPPSNQVVVNEIIVDLHELLAQYIRALVALSFATFVFYTGFLSSMSVPYAILLSGIAAILEFIPVAGPLAASVAILLVAAFTGYPHLLWIVMFLAIYRVFQDYVLNPYLMSSGVEVHPLLVLLGVLAGEQIAGVPGMFFSVPVIAALRVVFIRLLRQRRAD
jgi:predicted PurR-regulated permease PerM